MFRFLKENKSFSAVFLLAVLSRFLPLFRYQFSYDELSALSRTTYGSWHDLLQYGAQIDAHPVLIQCFLFAWVKMVGYSEIGIKLPFLFLSLGSIVYAYLFPLKWFGKKPALLSAVIFSFSFIFVYYSPLARMYASGLFFSTAFLYYWFVVLFDKTKTTKHYVWMTVFILLSALNSHIGCLFVLTCGLAGLFFLKKQDLFSYLAYCAAAVLLYLPHLSITLFQLDYGGIGASQDGWLAAPDQLVVFSLMKTLLGTGCVWIFFAVAAVACVMINADLISKKAVLLLLLFFLNCTIILLYSVYRAPVFQYSVMLFSAPCFVWGLASLFKNESRWMSGFIWLMAVLLCFQTFYVKAFYSNCVSNQNQFQYEAVRNLENKYGRNDVCAVFFDTEKSFVLFYELKDKHSIKYYLGTDTLVSRTESFRSLLQGLSARHLVLGNASPKNIAMCREFFPYISQGIQNSNINLCELSKRKEDQAAERFFEVADSATYSARGHYQFDIDKRLLKPGGIEITGLVDSTEEFPFTVRTDLRKVSSKEGQMILATAIIKSSEPLKDVTLDMSVANRRDSTLFFGGAGLKQFYTTAPEGYKVYTQVYLGSDYRTWKKGKLICFFWNRGKEKFTIRDFRIETIDYWPLKWGTWE